jgi:hypothetical protein
MKKSKYVLGGLAAAALAVPAAAMAGPVTLTATLAGEGEGAGSFEAEVDAEAGDICYILAVDGIGEATAAHIHGKDGKPVVTVSVTGEDLDECVASEPDTLKAILAAPGNYYVNVHTAKAPAGAIRGTLEKAD